PELHVHLAAHRRRGDEVLLRLLSLACSPVELAEAKVAVSDQGPHAARLGEHQSLAVARLAALSIEAVRMGCDVAEQVQRMGRESGGSVGRSDCTSPKIPRLVEPAEPQASAPERLVGPAPETEDSPCGVTLQELLAFPQPVQRLAGRTDLCQRP